MDLQKRDELVAYLADGQYPAGASENEKRVLRRAAKWFVLKNGRTLYHLRDVGKSSQGKTHEQRVDEATLVIVGDTDKRNILESVHSNLGGGHFGIRKTQEKISERYWWPGFSNDVEQFVKACRVCQLANPLNRAETAVLHPIGVTSELFYRWCIDLVGPLHETTQENRYIAVATEYLTRFAVAKAIPNKDAATVGQFIYKDIICMYGPPKILQHDQGREFCNNLSRFICDKLGVKEAISTAYHPQTNGLTERFNQTLVTQLMKVSNDKHNDWDQHIDSILFAYRVSAQSSIKKSPFQMLFGAKPRLPVDLQYAVHNDVDPVENFDEAVAKRMVTISEEIVRTREEGLKNLAEAQETQKRQFDAKHQGTYYDIGDEVLKYDRRRETRQGDKVKPRYTGPYHIHESCGKGVYRLLDPGTGRILGQKVNSRDLKIFVQDGQSNLKERKDPVAAAAASLDQERKDPAVVVVVAAASSVRSPEIQAGDLEAGENIRKRMKIIPDEDIELVKGDPREFDFAPVSSKWMREKCNQLGLKYAGPRRKPKPVKKSAIDSPPTTTQIIGDGNCLFRTLSHAITNSENSYSDIRRLVCMQIQKDAIRYLGSCDAESYFAKSKMRDDHVWGTDKEISAAADLLCTTIWCYGPFCNGFAWTEFAPTKRTSEEMIFIVNKNNHFEPLYKW